MPRKTKETSDKVASTAAKLLKDKNTSKAVKQVAASALVQKKAKKPKAVELPVSDDFRAREDRTPVECAREVAEQRGN